MKTRYVANILYKFLLAFASTALIEKPLDMPFLNAESNDVFKVDFQMTRDMFWFDVLTRSMKPSPSPDVDASILDFSLD